MQYEESELGRKSMRNADGGDGGAERDSPQRGDGINGSRRKNQYSRESLPPTFAASLDSSAMTKLTIGSDEPYLANGSGSNTPRDGQGYPAHHHNSSPIKRSDGSGSGHHLNHAHERGSETEVRKNGQYVHFRRAPVNEYTLQPMRRVSKAGLESVRADDADFGSAGKQGSESVTIEKARTPDERGMAEWL